MVIQKLLFSKERSMNSKLYKAFGLAAGLGLVIGLFWYFDIGHYFTLERLQEDSAYLKQIVERDYITAALVYIVLFAVIIATALPVVAPLTMLGGFLFGIFPGVIAADIGATLGAAGCFLIVRYVMRNTITGRYQKQLESFKNQLQQNGSSYLLTLQLVSVIPFFVINTLAALADVPLVTFSWTTAVGSFPFLLVYAFAGRQLHTMHSLSDIVKPSMLLLFAALGILALMPLLIRKLMRGRQIAP
jgi:uncharacterized membrane protein YdjX (TVP38/TMEM64 family)